MENGANMKNGSLFVPIWTRLRFLRQSGPLAGRWTKTCQEAFVKLWRPRQRQIENEVGGRRRHGRVKPRGLDEREASQSHRAFTFRNGAHRSRGYIRRESRRARRRQAEAFSGSEQSVEPPNSNSPANLTASRLRSLNCARNNARWCHVKIWKRADFCRDATRA